VSSFRTSRTGVSRHQGHLCGVASRVLSLWAGRCRDVEGPACRNLLRAGSKPGTAHHVHRTIRNALNEARPRGDLSQNPALLAKAPKLADDETEPYSVIEVRRLLALVAERRNGPRWVVALALGLRQGETLGLKWEHVDLDTGLIRIRRNRLRPKYEHGCGGKCGRKAGYCPDRKQVRADTGPTKSRAGRRVVGLPEPLIVLLRVHREHQETERKTARQLWHDEGWVFAKLRPCSLVSGFSP
jgi:integrase